MKTLRERLLRYGWAGIQALPLLLLLLGSTWAGYQWPLFRSSHWREGLTLVLLLTYTLWRSRRPWNIILMLVLAWNMGSVWKLYARFHLSLTFMSIAVFTTGLFSFLYALYFHKPRFWWFILGFFLWIAYATLWAFSLWRWEMNRAWWYVGVGVAAFFFLLVEGWWELGRFEQGTIYEAVGDLYIAFNVILWLLYTWWMG